MARFVLALLVVALAWWGWDVFLNKPVEAGTSSLGVHEAEPVLELEGKTEAPAGPNQPGKLQKADPAGQEGQAGQARQAKPGDAAEGGPRDPAAEPFDQLLEGLKTYDPKLAGQACGLLLRIEGKQRVQLGAALDKVVASTTELGKLLLLMGGDNSFLHSPEGRRLARRAVELSLATPGEQALERVSQILESCMQGPIARGHREARALVDEIYSRYQGMVSRIVLDPSRLTKARRHKVSPGESLDGIAARYRGEGICLEGTTLGFLNRISDPKNLAVGKVLKIPLEPIRVVVMKDSYLMAVYLGQTILRLYWVGHGKDGCTPVATFTVEEKLRKPDWYHDGRVIQYGHPDNVLGDYFVKFAHPTIEGIGAHGTDDPGSIGNMASLGCIRMRDNDIEEFFRIIPRGSQVQILAWR